MDNRIEKHRATRNRTLTVTAEEIPALETLVSEGDDLRSGFRDDMLVNADLLDCLELIPDAHFDLIILDPPYNLDKDFHGRKFSSMKSDDYEEYLRGWFGKVCDKLKPAGSLYMCGDWKCSLSMQRVVEERLTILNRITWQREKGRGAKSNWKNGMEDIWFAVKDPKHYTFNLDAVMMKRKVLAPYRVDGQPKDWDDTADGKFRLLGRHQCAVLVDAREHRPSHTEARKTLRQAHPRLLQPRRPHPRPLFRQRHHGCRRQEARPSLLLRRTQPRILPLDR